MKKFQVALLCVFLVACSQTAIPTAEQLSEQTSTPHTQAIAPSFTPDPTVVPTLTQLPITTSTLVPTPIGGGSGRIAFTSEQGGEQDIYVINVDRSNLVELAGDIASKFNPSWTLDGTKVSFSSATENSASLYIMNADGTHLTKALDTNEINVYEQIDPDSQFGVGCCSSGWSPDNTKIIFQTTRGVGCCQVIGLIHILNLNNNQLFTFGSGNWSPGFWSPDSKLFGFIGTDFCGGWLCIMNIADGKPVNLNGIYSVTFPSNLDWSPDGKQIAFAGFWNDSKNSDVYVMDADFSNPINMSGSLVKGQNGGPVWSPDSKKVAFTSCDVYLCELYAANADGTNSIKLTSQILGLNNIIWSHDSEKIVYVSAENGNDDIYMVNSDGSGTVNLTNNPAKDSNLVWSPDGTRVAFVSDRDGNNEIYIMDVSDMSLFRLTNIDANDHSPVWLP